MATNTSSADGRVQEIGLSAGETSPPVWCPQGATVACAPGNGGTMLVEATFSRPERVNAGTATWFPWSQGSSGAVSSKAYQRLSNATAVRFTATGAAGIGEVTR